MKTSINDLAIFGGPPAFAKKLHVGGPNTGDRAAFLARVNQALDRNWLTNAGPFVTELEQRLANLLGVRHCILVNNGTIGLEIAIRAAGLQGEVIVPALTFVATAHALQWQGIRPVFCDVDPHTHTLDPAAVERAITPATSGILGVHLWGRPAAVEALTEIAQRHKLKLLFDAAHAFGCSYNGQMIGNFGDAEVFSFHATKFFNTLEGGAIATNDDDLAARARLMKNFGFEDYDRVVSLGTNGKMTEISAAMGLTQLEGLPEIVATNRRNYAQYRAELAGIPGLRMVTYAETERSNYQYIIFEVDEMTLWLDRDRLVEVLWAENVLARRYFFPGCHRMEPYRSLDPLSGLRLPETEKLVTRLIALPTGSTVGPDEISRICEIIRLAVQEGAAVSAQLCPAAESPAARTKPAYDPALSLELV